MFGSWGVAWSCWSFNGEWKLKQEVPSSIFDSINMSQVDNDGFTVVERKFKYLNVNADKNGRRKRKGRYKFQDPDDYTVSDLRSILDQQRYQRSLPKIKNVLFESFLWNIRLSETLVQSKFYSDLHGMFCPNFWFSWKVLVLNSESKRCQTSLNVDWKRRMMK